jgi:8-oxo-dGTP pyrophosphatase MutT (NUDIX family)
LKPVRSLSDFVGRNTIRWAVHIGLGWFVDSVSQHFLMYKHGDAGYVILLAGRSVWMAELHNGDLTFFGGKSLRRETPIEAAIRELEEESDLAISADKVAEICRWVEHAKHWIFGVDVFATLFIYVLAEGEIPRHASPAEHNAIRLCTIDELRKTELAVPDMDKFRILNVVKKAIDEHN